MNETKTTPKDFFLNLGALICLYFSLISFLNLIFAIIDKYLPDAVSGYDFGLYTIRWTISILIILFPLYIYLSRLIHADIYRIPEKKNLWIRKWSSYLTLFLTGATIAVDLIILINVFLGGEITVRFVAKIISVLIVSALVFAYGLYDLRRVDIGEKSRLLAISIIASIIVLITIVIGFMAAGSPFAERNRRFDNQRVQDLTSIQYQITNYWQKKGALPLSLSDLNDPLSSFTIPRDPENKTMYEYATKDATHFELCATFSLPSSTDASQTYPAYPDNAEMSNQFAHGAGRTCFDRGIDPALYPVEQNQPMQLP